ncbi:MAG: carbonic anhydrase [Bacteroidota bacterium]
MKNEILKYLSLFLFVLLTVNVNAQLTSSPLEKLIEGNKRFAADIAAHQNQNSNRREETAQQQKPFAVIITCSDSRVPPEILFDQGIGDLFVIRTAGNLVDDIALGSIEYAVEHLKVSLIVVLGHERCGAVDAAVKNVKALGYIKSLVDNIAKAVDKARIISGDLLENSIKQNVDNVVEKIRSSKPVLEEFVLHNKIKVIGARYDLDEGIITFYEN